MYAGIVEILKEKSKPRSCQWISVSERLPEEMETFIGWHKDGFVVLTTNSFDELEDITHWMPLPQPPEGGCGMKIKDIVMALRCCYRDVDADGCVGCPLEILDYPCNEYNLELKAADIIESLQAQLAESQRREMEVDDIADFIIQNEDSIRLAMDTQDRRYLENIIISWRCGSEDGE